MDVTIIRADGESERLTNCEKKMAVFCAINAYQHYDVGGRPEHVHRITEAQLAAVNRAMGARAPHEPWKQAGLLCNTLDKLKQLAVDDDLIEMSDERWHQVRPLLAAL